MDENIEEHNRRSVSTSMKDAWHKEYDYIEVTEWSNGEGYDIDISGEKSISLHFTEYDVIKKLIKHIEKTNA